MTKLEHKFESVIKQLRKRYSFLEDVAIDVVEGYGLKGATHYDPDTRAIYLDLKTLRRIHKTPRFERRLGRNLSFSDFVLHVLLHEFAHVKQFDIIPNHRLYAVINESDYDSDSGHDECWVEKG